jgi:transposase-like protein
MSKKRNYPQRTKGSPQRVVRTFSEELKRKKVAEIEQGLSTVAEVSRSLEVSQTSVYVWIRKYSLTYERPIKMIVESKSESKRIIQLKEKIAELERLVGQKQIQLEVTEKMLDLASEELGVDLKKKFATGPSTGIGKDGKSKAGK